MSSVDRNEMFYFIANSLIWSAIFVADSFNDYFKSDYNGDYLLNFVPGLPLVFDVMPLGLKVEVVPPS